MAVPNLDAMNEQELYDFARLVHSYRRRTARILFGDPLPKGHKRAYSDLKNYTWNVITARATRGRGETQTAAMYEDIADRIYRGLPQYARW